MNPRKKLTDIISGNAELEKLQAQWESAKAADDLKPLPCQRALKTSHRWAH